MVLKNSQKTSSYPTKLPQPLQRKKKFGENSLPIVKQSRYHKLDHLRDAHYVGVGFVTSFDPGLHLFCFALLKVHC